MNFDASRSNVLNPGGLIRYTHHNQRVHTFNVSKANSNLQSSRFSSKIYNCSWIGLQDKLVIPHDYPNDHPNDVRLSKWCM